LAMIHICKGPGFPFLACFVITSPLLRFLVNDIARYVSIFPEARVDPDKSNGSILDTGRLAFFHGKQPDFP
jgi:hypothetical protein